MRMTIIRDMRFHAGNHEYETLQKGEMVEVVNIAEVKKSKDPAEKSWAHRYKKSEHNEVVFIWKDKYRIGVVGKDLQHARPPKDNTSPLNIKDDSIQRTSTLPAWAQRKTK